MNFFMPMAVLTLFATIVKQEKSRELAMGRMIILWMLGVPISVLIILKLLGII